MIKGAAISAASPPPCTQAVIPTVTGGPKVKASSQTKVSKHNARTHLFPSLIILQLNPN